MQRLRQMAVFAHIVESGSITAAAEHLVLSKSVVSQHLKILESELGVSLLTRTTRRQTLTEAGKAFYQHCKQMNELADSAWYSAQKLQKVPQGKLKVTAPNALMETLVIPVVSRLMAEFPLLRPELISHDQHLDLIDQNIDIAVRVGQSANSNLIQRRIGEFRDVLCGIPKTIAQADVESLPYIANAWQPKIINHHFESTSAASFNYVAAIRCTTDSFHSCLGLIESGAGIGIVPEFYLPRAASILQPVFADARLPKQPIYVLHGFSNGPPLSVTVFINEIEKQLAL